MTIKAGINIPLQFQSILFRNALTLILLVLLAWGCNGGGGRGDSSGPQLAWDAPSYFTNGDQILSGDLKGYRLYYRSENELYSFTNSFFVSVPAASVAIADLNLSPGKYYFVVTAVDSMDVESDFSNECSTQIN